MIMGDEQCGGTQFDSYSIEVAPCGCRIDLYVCTSYSTIRVKQCEGTLKFSYSTIGGKQCRGIIIRINELNKCYGR